MKSDPFVSLAYLLVCCSRFRALLAAEESKTAGKVAKCLFDAKTRNQAKILERGHKPSTPTVPLSIEAALKSPT